MRGLIFILSLGFSGAGFAASWVHLAIPHTDDKYYYDRSKLVIDGEQITYWKKALFKPPRAIKNQLAASGLMRERIDCHEHTLRLLSYLYHDAKGGVIEYVAEAEKEGAPIIPETVGDWFEQALCSKLRPVDREREAMPLKMNAHALR